MSRDHGLLHASQRDALLEFMLDLRWHPHFELASISGVRYSARLLELKRLGFQFEDQEIVDVNDVGGKAYRLISPVPKAPQRKRVKVLLDEVDAKSICFGRVTNGARRSVRDALKSFQINRHKL